MGYNIMLLMTQKVNCSHHYKIHLDYLQLLTHSLFQHKIIIPSAKNDYIWFKKY